MITQPPSGGCVLKLLKSLAGRREASQPPSGGCVLKPEIGYTPANLNQPPSGGCVLKQVVLGAVASGLPSRLRAAVC